MAIVFEEVTGEIDPPAARGETPATAAAAEREPAPIEPEALRAALARRERLLARRSAD